jgi:hypothetical protein
MLHKIYQLDASQGYLLRLCLKIKIHWGAAHLHPTGRTSFLPITMSWAEPKVMHTQTHTQNKLH